MKLEELKKATPAELADINNLLRQLVHDLATYKPISLDTLEQILSDKKTIMVVARENERIIGMGLIYAVIKPRGYYGYLEDMVVDESQRGKGIGEAICRQLITSAKNHGIATIELSARPSRIAANKLYQKLGLEAKDTNVYRMKL